MSHPRNGGPADQGHAVPNRVHAVLDSPLGQITVVAATGPNPALVGLYLDRRRYPPSPAQLGEPLPEDVTSCRSYRGDVTSSWL